MKPSPFDYVRAESIDHAVAELARADGEGVILAGGQTLMPLLALRMAQPAVVIDINRIDGLAGVSKVAGATRIGATTRQNSVLADPLVAQHVPALAKAVRYVGHHQTRNRGTVGGSVSLGEPAAELPATAVTLGARIEARSSRGTRLIAAEEFYVGPYSTVLEPDELVTAVIFPDLPAGTLTIVHEVARRPGDFALVGLVSALTLEGGVFKAARIGWFGMGPTPMRSPQAEAALIGQSLSGVDLVEIGRLAASETDPLDDHHADAAYRRTVGARVFRRAVSQALEARKAA